MLFVINRDTGDLCALRLDLKTAFLEVAITVIFAALCLL